MNETLTRRTTRGLHWLRDPAPGMLERRLFRRYPSGLPATVIAQGRPHACRITDLSLGGAALEPALPDLDGAPIELTSHGFAFEHPLRGRVVATSRHGMHVVLELDPQTENALARHLRERQREAMRRVAHAMQG